MSRVARRLVLAMLAAALLPLIFALFLTLSLTEVSMGLGLNDTVQRGLNNDLPLYKDLFNAKKAQYQAQAQALARDPMLTRALRDHVAKAATVDGQKLPDPVNTWMHTQFQSLPELTRLRLSQGEKSWQQKNANTDGGRPLQINLPIDFAAPAQLSLTFHLPGRFVQGLDEARELSDTYQQIAAARDSITRALLLSFAGVLSLILIGSVLLGLALARSMTRRLTALSQATAQLASGVVDVHVPEQGDDEITALARAFNSMVIELSERRDRIVYLEKISGWQEVARRLAHEIKNPLTPIILAVQQLDEKKPGDNLAYAQMVQTAREVIEEEVGALRRLVEEFSAFAKLPRVQVEVCDARDFLHEIVEQLRSMHPDVDLQETERTGLGAVALDRMLMRRVITNLVLNAVQAQSPPDLPTPSQVPTVWLQAWREGDILSLLVEDAGPGIDQSLKDHLFEPYMTTKSAGTGLGLAIVKKIVLQHGGKISAGPSLELGGACFTITLPVASQNLLGQAALDHGDTTREPGPDRSVNPKAKASS